MLTYTLHEDPYDAEIMFIEPLEREIEPGLTVLVGCNGSGKTTILNNIKSKYLKESDCKVFHWDGLVDKKFNKDRSLDAQRFDILATLAFSSEGEEINTNIGILAQRIGSFVKKSEDKDIVILLDGLDSGLSIDNIVDTKDFFKSLLIPDIEKNGHKCYIIVSANEYELARGETCIDARSGKKMKFKDYEDYRKFILKSKEEKVNREQTR